MKWAVEDGEGPIVTFQWMAEGVEAWVIQQVDQLMLIVRTREQQLPELVNLLGGAMLRAGLANISMNSQQSQAMKNEFVVNVKFGQEGFIEARIERRQGIVAASEGDMKRILSGMNLKEARGN